MDNQCSPLLSSWAYYCQGKSMEDLRHSLLYATMELEQTRAAAQEELRKRDEQLSHLRDLLNNAIREKDEAQDKCQRLFLEKLLLQQQLQQQHNHTAPLSGMSSIEDDPRRGGIDSNNGGGFSSSDCEESIVSSPVIDPIPPTQLPLPPSSLQKQIGNLVPDKPLPEKGKLLQAVRNAGPLLQTLLLAGPLPQWRHPPPPLESFEIPPVTITSPPIPLPKPLLLHQDSLLSVNGCNRKRALCEGSDSPNSETKYQRVVHH
ncbi:PREDICTED: uncharacterized protein LOC101295363 [Fragaria vesca subsp. vesca]|uniref:uncharacterized protein LOC101295363 n=1 Tax=Fragaria vesca subsp. vesca TaxID=101020 RepID=UPI0002C31859|nr:PREDICTED: uncharacterized protein LOC101295363 [Fragaria vesca subsp. vesca]